MYFRAFSRMLLKNLFFLGNMVKRLIRNPLLMKLLRKLFPVDHPEVDYYFKLLGALGEIHKSAKAKFLDEENIDLLEQRIENFKQILLNVNFSKLFSY